MQKELPEEVKRLLIDRPLDKKITETEKRTILFLKILKNWDDGEITIDDIIKQFWFQFEHRIDSRAQVSWIINQEHIRDIFGENRKKKTYIRDGVEYCGYCYRINRDVLENRIEEYLQDDK